MSSIGGIGLIPDFDFFQIVLRCEAVWPATFRTASPSFIVAFFQSLNLPAPR